MQNNQIEVLLDKLFKLAESPEIATHQYAGIRQHLGEIATIVNNELEGSNEKIYLISEKLLRVGSGYDISGAEFEQFRRSLAATENYVNHKMIGCEA